MALTATDVLDAARDLAPLIRDLSPEIDRSRRLPEGLVEKMRAAGLFALLLPAEYGGRQVDPVISARVVEEVARADGSAGWCVMIANQNAALSGLMDPVEARTIWGDGAVCAGTARPIGRAVATTDPEPGYRVSGRWPFASGSSHAGWFAAECIVYDGDQPRRDADGNEVSRFCFVPREQVTIHDTWDTLGLRGTASNDFSVDNAFVPAARGFQVLVDEPRSDWTLYRALPLVFINHGTQSLGVARGALDSATEILASKIGWGGVALKQMSRMQAALAQATAMVEAASAYLYQASEDLWQAALQGRDDSRLRANVRLANSHAAAESVRAIDLLHGVCATTAIFSKSPLERQFRDIHTAAAHVMIGPMTFEAAGRVLLGMEPDFPFF